MIYLQNRTRGAGLDTRALAGVLERLLAEIGERGTSVSLTFVRDAEMRELNREHREKDVPTDVLSFPLYPPEAFDRTGATRPAGWRILRQAQDDIGDPDDGVGQARDDRPERMLGDIVVSVDTARRQADAYDAPLAREIERLLIHAVLHLAGHDHLETAERTVMEAEERRLADAIGMPWPYLV
ncbi:MAG TPA: rRNA maturation RNase YbeY, partial [Candidatus Elarobacter sp.]